MTWIFAYFTLPLLWSLLFPYLGHFTLVYNAEWDVLMCLKYYFICFPLLWLLCLARNLILFVSILWGKLSSNFNLAQFGDPHEVIFSLMKWYLHGRKGREACKWNSISQWTESYHIEITLTLLAHYFSIEIILILLTYYFNKEIILTLLAYDFNHFYILLVFGGIYLLIPHGI